MISVQQLFAFDEINVDHKINVDHLQYVRIVTCRQTCRRLRVRELYKTC